jgi:RHS repeat-associated protein
MGIGIDEPIAMETLPGQTGMRYVHYMQSTLGNVVGITDNTGAVVERYTYDAYGAPRFENAGNVPYPPTNQKSAYGNSYLFTGRRYEPWILPLYEYRNRFYLPQQGRFVQRDPNDPYYDTDQLGNPCSYTGLRPNDYLDPDGCDDINLIPAGAKASAEDKGMAAKFDKAELKSDELSVAGHGYDFGEGMIDSNGNDMPVDKLAGMIKNHKKYKANPRIKIRLNSCNTGTQPQVKGQKSFAERLRDALGQNEVTAPNQVIKVAEDGYAHLPGWRSDELYVVFLALDTGCIVPSTGVGPMPPGARKQKSK